jgi:hypothetical protein
MHGQGIMTSYTGEVYTGGFYNGLKHGLCRETIGNMLGEKFICPSGHLHGGNGLCELHGNYDRGALSGNGTLKCFDGRAYQGQWLKGCRQGQGTQQYLRDGEEGDPERMFIGGVDSMYRARLYAGTWVENVREGYGVLTYVNGDSIEGIFERGQPHGVCLNNFLDRKGRKEEKGWVKKTRKMKTVTEVVQDLVLKSKYERKLAGAIESTSTALVTNASSTDKSRTDDLDNGDLKVSDVAVDSA